MGGFSTLGGELTWEQIKQKLENEGAKNKAYDSDVDGVLDAGAIPNLDASKITSGVLDLARIPSIPSSKLGFGLAWEHVTTIEVTSNVQSIDVTGLDGDSDIMYMIIGYAVNADSSNSRSIYLRFNDDTGDNYGWQTWYNYQGTVNTNRSDSDSKTLVINMNADGKLCAFVLVYAKSGVERRTLGIAMNMKWIAHSGGNWHNTSDNITKITFYNPAGAYIGAGSKFYLFKLANI